MPLLRGSRPVRTVWRKTGWQLGPGGTDLLSSTTDVNAFLGSALAIAQDGITLVRSRGLLTLTLVSSTAGGGFIGVFGIGNVKADAVAGGITVVPTPLTNAADEDWIYWSPVAAIAGVAVPSEGEGQLIEHVVDSKAMRKLDAGDSIYAAIEMIEKDTANIRVSFDSRMLFKLP